MTFSIYLGGVIQGSNKNTSNVNQDYREVIKKIIHKTHPSATIICPWEIYPSVPLENGEEIFIGLVERARKADLIIAYLPEASMGTAVELWKSYENDKPIIVISPMRNNLMIRTVSIKIVSSLDEFEELILSGYLNKIQGLLPMIK